MCKRCAAQRILMRRISRKVLEVMYNDVHWTCHADYGVEFRCIICNHIEHVLEESPVIRQQMPGVRLLQHNAEYCPKLSIGVNPHLLSPKSRCLTASDIASIGTPQSHTLGHAYAIVDCSAIRKLFPTMAQEKHLLYIRWSNIKMLKANSNSCHTSILPLMTTKSPIRHARFQFSPTTHCPRHRKSSTY